MTPLTDAELDRLAELVPKPFLRAILSAPNDPLPRMAYADWLDERGESERAAFVRERCVSVPCKNCSGLGMYSVTIDPVRWKGSCRGGGRRKVTYRKMPSRDVLCGECDASGMVLLRFITPTDWALEARP